VERAARAGLPMSYLACQRHVDLPQHPPHSMYTQKGREAFGA